MTPYATTIFQFMRFFISCLFPLVQHSIKVCDPGMNGLIFLLRYFLMEALLSRIRIFNTNGKCSSGGT